MEFAIRRHHAQTSIVLIHSDWQNDCLFILSLLGGGTSKYLSGMRSMYCKNSTNPPISKQTRFSEVLDRASIQKMILKDSVLYLKRFWKTIQNMALKNIIPFAWRDTSKWNMKYWNSESRIDGHHSLHTVA